MSSQEGSAHRNICVERTGRSPMRGREMRQKVERELHGCVLAADAALKRAPGPIDWRYDLRRGRVAIGATFLRFVDAAIAHDAPDVVIELAVAELSGYALGQLDARRRLRGIIAAPDGKAA